jgi:hypothetical protein
MALDRGISSFFWSCAYLFAGEIRVKMEVRIKGYMEGSPRTGKGFPMTKFDFSLRLDQSGPGLANAPGCGA